MAFAKAYPDTRETGGVRALTDEGWEGLWRDLRISKESEFVKHLLELHSGEVRFVREPEWMDFPISDGGFLFGVNHRRFWHSQTMRHDETAGSAGDDNAGIRREKRSPQKLRCPRAMRM